MVTGTSRQAAAAAPSLRLDAGLSLLRRAHRWARVLPQGGEFKGIRETGHFHLPELPVRDLRALIQPVRLADTHRRLLCQDLKNFGMKKDLWIKRCRLPLPLTLWLRVPAARLTREACLPRACGGLA